MPKPLTLHLLAFELSPAACGIFFLPRVAFTKYRATYMSHKDGGRRWGVAGTRDGSTPSGVLNTPSYGAGLKFAPEARIDDGVLDLVLVEDLPFGRTPTSASWAYPTG